MTAPDREYMRELVRAFGDWSQTYGDANALASTERRRVADRETDAALAALEDAIDALYADRERLRVENERRNTLVVQLHDLAAQLWDTLDSTQQRSFAEEVGAEDRSINHVVDAYYRRAAAQEDK